MNRRIFSKWKKKILKRLNEIKINYLFAKEFTVTVIKMLTVLKRKMNKERTPKKKKNKYKNKS